MRLTMCGANRQVTGSCHLLETGGLRLAVDCGMFQERALLARNWEPKPFDAAAVDALLLTHAHLDHTGLLPRLVEAGFRGPIWTTKPTVDLAQLVLRDAARLQEEDAAYKTRRHRREGRTGPHPVRPLYTVEQAEAVTPLLRGVSFREPVTLDALTSARFLEAGHILGAAIVELTVRQRSGTRHVVFSGDLGQWDMPIVPDPAAVERADTIVLESTYGDEDHAARLPVLDALAEEVHAAVDAGGPLLIPTFAIERAQELLLHLGELMLARRIPRLRMFLDSPMAADATEIYRRHPAFMDQEPGLLVRSSRLEELRPLLEFVRSAEDSKALNELRGTNIIMAGSGMCTGGRIKHHLKNNIERPETTVLFVGYQAEGTLGREIVTGAPRVRILGETLGVHARIRQIQGLSGHADRTQLMRWLGKLRDRPRRLVLTHGEEQAALSLAAHVREKLGWNVEVPRYGEVLEL